MLQGGSRREFTDSTLVSGTAYTYRVQAMAGSKMSALTDPANVATALASPQGLRATPGTSSIALAWTAVDAKATGLNVQRSVAGGAFTTIASLGTAVRAFTDSTAATGTAYTYRLVATKPNIPSGTSATAAATIAAPARPANPGVAGITISTRYGNELVITATTGNAPIEVTKSGANLRIMSGTTQLSSIAMPGSLFIYDRGGTHAIRIDASVGIRTTVSSVGGGTSNITSAHSNVSVWMDTTDQFTGSGTVHRVGTLAGNVSKAVGISLANPSDSGRTVDANASLWGSGPVAADVNQGAVGDCYLLASLAAFAVSKPSVLLESAVDLGDSTYLVQFMRQNAPVYVRVSDDLPSPSGRNMQFARPGSSGTVWAPVMEKAFAYFRTGANTYASISGGWMADAYTALGVRSSTITMGMTSTAFFSMVSSAFNSGKAVTFGTSNSAPSLVRGHAYTLVGVSRDAGGVARYTFRNPWGASGTSIENAAGITTLTFEQMQANFTVGVMAA